jgi:hypothetical protein
MSEIRRLLQILEPPVTGGTAVDWSLTEREYGHGFPRDYADFMAHYGEGALDDFLSVCAPFAYAYPNDPSSCVRGVTENARYTAEQEGYPEPDSLVGWGTTADADLLCWRMTCGDPNRWTSVIWRRQWDSPECWVELDCGMVETIYRWATNRIPRFGVENLEMPYSGSRFLRPQDEKQFRSRGVDPWGPDLAG